MKFLKFDVLIVGILVVEFIVAGCFGLTLFAETPERYSYCDDLGESLANANEGVLDYWERFDQEGKTMLVSPLALQTGVYNYYNENGIEDVTLFKQFRDGYKSWDESGVEDDSFSLYYPESPEALEEELGECVYTKGCIYAVFRLDSKIESAWVNNDKIYVSGRYGYEDGSVLLPLTDGYEVCLGSYHTDEPVKDVVVEIDPYIWQAHGIQTGLLNSFGAMDYPIRVFSEFSFRGSDYSDGDEVTPTVVFSDDYELFIRNKETGVLVGVGRR